MVAAAVRWAPDWVVVDFDGTCTVRDTTPLLPHLAEAHAPSLPSGPSKLDRFGALERDFLAGLQGIASKHGLGPEAVDGIAAGADEGPGLDTAGLEAYLAECDALSSAITAQVSTSGCLVGIRAADVAATLDEWADAASSGTGSHAPEPPRLREGCAEALKAVQSAGSYIGVLSVNWCPPLIDALLRPSGCKYTLWSNDIDEEGRVTLHVAGAAEKQANMRRLLADRTTSTPSVVYVGDSATDLPALLAADVGVLIGSSASARRTARRFGVRLRPLPDADADAIQASPLAGPGALWEATSWRQISRLLLGAVPP